DRPRDEAALVPPETARRPLLDRPVPDHAQHRRRDHGHRSAHQRRQPLPAIVGCVEPVRDGFECVSAEPWLQPDRYGRGVDVLGARCNQEPVPQESGSAGLMTRALATRSGMPKERTKAISKTLCAGFLAMAALAVSRPSHAADDASIERGKYLVRAGDCAACHTAEGGKPFAGGRAMGTPFG